MKTLIIVPAYNEQDNILTVYNEYKRLFPNKLITKEVFPFLADDSVLIGSTIDLLVINDCSTDCTEAILSEHQISYISAPVNLGIGGAVQTGYKYALNNDYDAAIQIDGDGQHDMSYIPTLLSELRLDISEKSDAADLTIGSRFLEKEGFQSSGTRRIGINLLSFFIFICTFRKIYDVTSGYRAINRLLIRIYANDYPEDYPEPEAIVSAVMYNCKIKELPVRMRERMGGKSSINLKKSVYYMIKVTLAIFITRISFGIRRDRS